MERLKEHLTAHGIRPSAFAKSIGISPQRMSQILNEGSDPSVKTLRKMRKESGLTADEILGPDKPAPAECEAAE